MAEDIDIEEHDVLDNPAVKKIFPNLAVVKNEFVDFGIEECTAERDCRSASTNPSDLGTLESDGESTITVLPIVLPKREYQTNDSLFKDYRYVFKKEAPDQAIVDGELSNFFNNKIILGSKRVQSTSNLKRNSKTVTSKLTKNKILSLKKLAANTNSKVLVRDCLFDVKRSKTYCVKCKILFTTAKAFACHKIEKHYDVKDADTSVVDTVTAGANHKAGRFLCHICDESVVRLSSLRQHYKKQHNQNVPNRVIYKDDVSVLNETNKLSKPTENESVLKNSGDNNFCNHCKSKFSSKRELIQHMYDVLGSKMFECSECSMKFDNKENLQSHVLTHRTRKRAADPNIRQNQEKRRKTKVQLVSIKNKTNAIVEIPTDVLESYGNVSVKDSSKEQSAEIAKPLTKKSNVNNQKRRKLVTKVDKVSSTNKTLRSRKNILSKELSSMSKKIEKIVTPTKTKESRDTPSKAIPKLKIKGKKKLKKALVKVHVKQDLRKRQYFDDIDETISQTGEGAYFKCQVCSYYVDLHKRLQIDQHMKDYHKKSLSIKYIRSDFEPKCILCSQSFDTVLGYNEHLKNQHLKLLPIVKNVPKRNKRQSRPYIFLCGGCKKKFLCYNTTYHHSTNEHPDLQRHIVIKIKNGGKHYDTVHATLRNPPIPRSVLFKCRSCDIHYLSYVTAFQHGILCKSYTKDVYKCEKCHKQLKLKNKAFHNLQHKFSDSFKVITATEDKEMYKKILCHCPKCSIHFGDNKFWLHYKKCGIIEPCSSYYCPECDILIDDTISSSHIHLHNSSKANTSVFHIIEYDIVDDEDLPENVDDDRKNNEYDKYTVDSDSESDIPSKDLSLNTTSNFVNGSSNDKNKETIVIEDFNQNNEKLNDRDKLCDVERSEVSSENNGNYLEENKASNNDDVNTTVLDDELSNNNTVKSITSDAYNFLYCDTCGCFSSLNNFADSIMHRTRSCIGRRKTCSVCKFCGLKLSSKQMGKHINYHEILDNFDLFHFTFYSPFKEKIDPKAPEYPVCIVCKTQYYPSQKYGSDKHECHQELQITCNICKIDFTDSAYKLHYSFHEYPTKKCIKEYTEENTQDKDTVKEIEDETEFPKDIPTHKNNIPSGEANASDGESTTDEEGYKYKYYQCRNCDVCIKKKMNIKIHSCLPINHRVKCSECDLCFAAHNFRAHYLQHRKTKKFIRTNMKVQRFGKKVSKHKPKLPNKIQSSEKKMKKKTTTTKTTLDKAKDIQHVQTKYTLYQCQKCKLSYHVVGETKSHVCGKISPYRCLICKFTFDKCGYEKHIRLHSLNSSFRRSNVTVIEFLSKNTNKNNIIDTAIKNCMTEIASNDENKVKIYKCPCGLNFLSKPSIDSHMPICGPKFVGSKQLCTKCNLSFTPDVLFEHIMSHHNKKTEQFRYELVEISQTIDQKDNLYECGMCKLLFVEETDLIDHFRLCDPNRVTIKRECKECGLPFHHSMIGLHKMKHHNKVNFERTNFDIITLNKTVQTHNVLFKCRDCDRHFLKKSSVYSHVIDQDFRPPTKCDDCGLVFSIHVAQFRHKRLHHKKFGFQLDDLNIRTIPYMTKTGEYIYKNQGYKHNVAGALLKNMSMNKGSNDLYKCIDCDLHFVAKCGFDFHVNVQNHKIDGDIDKCDICSLNFYKNTMKRHKFIHHNQMNCQIEDYVLITNQNSDEEAKPNVTLYKCKCCDGHFISRLRCICHMTHYKRSDYTEMKLCNKCGLKFSKNSFHKHQMLHHYNRDYKLSEMIIEEVLPIYSAKATETNAVIATEEEATIGSSHTDIEIADLNVNSQVEDNDLQEITETNEISETNDDNDYNSALN